MHNTDWQNDAACQGLRNFADWSDDAQKIYCADCPVRLACLTYALGFESGQGFETENPVYGGLTGRERRNLLIRRAKARRAVAA